MDILFLPQVLIFSYWADVLDILGHAFEANDIPFVKVRSREESS